MCCLNWAFFDSTTIDVQQSVKGDDGLMCDVLSTSENVITHVIFQQRLKLDTEYVDQVGVHVLKE